jgi:hypothetical protein
MNFLTQLSRSISWFWFCVRGNLYLVIYAMLRNESNSDN